MVSRNTFVGLSGKSWGTALLGRHDTPYKIATRKLDIFADTIADNRNIMGYNAGSVGGGNAVAHDIRANNVIAYISPNFSGFTAAAAYVAGAEGATTSGQKKGDAWSLMGNYDNGPVYAALAWQKFKLGNVSALSATLAGDVDKSYKAWKIGGGYNFGAFKVGAVYERFTDDFATKADRNAWTLNGAYTFGSNAVKLAYTKAGDTGGVSNTGAKQWTLGLDHNFSKRTAVYALYSKVDNDSAARYGVGTGVGGGAVSAVAAGADPSAWSFGVKHSF
jgi:predicted porin